jgi:acetolactate synthase-1/3 small subunit
MTDPMLTLRFQHRPGAFDRIVSLLRRRGFPVSGMTLERTHQAGIGRMTVVVDQPAMLEQVARHLRKLPDVLEVTTAGDDEAVRREYALARIRCTPEQRSEATALIEIFDGRVVSAEQDQMVIEATGAGAKLDELFANLERFGIEDSARTSAIALRRSA